MWTPSQAEAVVVSAEETVETSVVLETLDSVVEVVEVELIGP